VFEPEPVCLIEDRFGGNSSERFFAYGDGPKFVGGTTYENPTRFKVGIVWCTVWVVTTLFGSQE
jgi:hypothetical protein